MLNLGKLKTIEVHVERLVTRILQEIKVKRLDIDI